MSDSPDKPKLQHEPTSFTVDDVRSGRVWAISDPHWGHAKIVGAAARPGYSHDGQHDEQEHERLIERLWKARVRAGDKVLVGGDVAWNSSGASRAAEAELEGEVEVIQGNHDNRGVRKDVVKKLGWKFINPVSIEWTVDVHDKHTKTTTSHTRLVVITHYAIRKEKLPEGVVNLHGHDHGTGSPYTDHRHRSYSAEVIGYGPVPLAALLDQLVIQAVGEGAGQVDPHEAVTLQLALANRIS
jgi:calcineurin-like phosphoesterase family protein